MARRAFTFDLESLDLADRVFGLELDIDLDTGVEIDPAILFAPQPAPETAPGGVASASISVSASGSGASSVSASAFAFSGDGGASASVSVSATGDRIEAAGGLSASDATGTSALAFEEIAAGSFALDLDLASPAFEFDSVEVWSI